MAGVPERVCHGNGSSGEKAGGGGNGAPGSGSRGRPVIPARSAPLGAAVLCEPVIQIVKDQFIGGAPFSQFLIRRLARPAAGYCAATARQSVVYRWTSNARRPAEGWSRIASLGRMSPPLEEHIISLPKR